jgi:hypothetical protein
LPGIGIVCLGAGVFGEGGEGVAGGRVQVAGVQQRGDPVGHGAGLLAVVGVDGFGSGDLLAAGTGRAEGGVDAGFHAIEGDPHSGGHSFVAVGETDHC